MVLSRGVVQPGLHVTVGGLLTPLRQHRPYGSRGARGSARRHSRRRLQQTRRGGALVHGAPQASPQHAAPHKPSAYVAPLCMCATPLHMWHLTAAARSIRGHLCCSAESQGGSAEGAQAHRARACCSARRGRARPARTSRLETQGTRFG